MNIHTVSGYNEVGKNMTALEIGEDIIVIDAGMHFSNEATPGVDYVIPNTTYLEERKEKIASIYKGIIGPRFKNWSPGKY